LADSSQTIIKPGQFSMESLDQFSVEIDKPERRTEQIAALRGENPSLAGLL